MMKMTMVLGLSGLVAMSGCASALSEDERAAAVTGAADEQQIIYNTNADGTWSADAQKPQFDELDFYTMRARGTFTGPAGKTRKMGVCLLKHTTTPCTTVADCSSSPATLPTGGFRYCTGANGGPKYCAFRPGTQGDLCGGSPGLGGVAVAPGYYESGWYFSSGNAQFLSYACFEGCSASDPSSSSMTLSPFYCQKNPSNCM
jgi:hypothetical protein